MGLGGSVKYLPKVSAGTGGLGERVLRRSDRPEESRVLHVDTRHESMIL